MKKKRNSMNINTSSFSENENENEKRISDTDSEVKSRKSLESQMPYQNSIYSKLSSEDNHNNKLIDLYSKDKDNKIYKVPIQVSNGENSEIGEYYQKYNKIKNKTEKSKNILCQYCKEYGDGNFTILNCNHIFHITCLANEHFEDSKVNVIDEEYFYKRKCLVCNEQLELEDIQLIHNKYHKHTKEYIKQQQDHILNLDTQMNKIKEELRVCYIFKEKLEKEKEKSKQIILTINTLI